MIDIEAQHRLAQHRSHFNPNQPRVPAGNPDGGQWTRTGASRIEMRLAAADKPRLGPHALLAIAVELAQRVIEAYRSENGPWDLFGHKRGAVAFTNIDGRDIFGSNSTSPTYMSADRAAAEGMRATLMKEHPDVLAGGNIGQMPANALFHAEATVLLRAARQRGGTLAGQRLTVFADTPLCNHCQDILPYVGLELGNPTVTFIGPEGLIMTMRDGAWIDGRGK
ncbi:MAG: hypothetical protein WBW74_16100 [Xanthobacteraceae bacterium]